MDLNLFKGLFGSSENGRNQHDDFQKQAQLNHAENMARSGFSTEEIMGSTGLSQNQVDFLESQNGMF